MLKAYDVECKECGKVEEQFIDHREESFEPCSECGCKMKRIFNSCNFSLISNRIYSTSHLNSTPD